MSEEMILPGQNNFDSSDMTTQDFKSEILSNNIKSTFLKDGNNMDFPMICIDMSKSSMILHTSMEALKKLLLPETSEEINVMHIYIKAYGDKVVKVGKMREDMARHILPSFIKSTFPDDILLYISEDGNNVEEFKKASLVGVKLEFDY